MLSSGEKPPAFTLPAAVEGDIESVSLDEYLGDRIVILAFYPGDFNPACGEESDLDELDLFTMQPDVAVIGIAPDTVFSHRAFAEEYDLAIPLAADTRGEVADAYGVSFEDDHGQPPDRAGGVRHRSGRRRSVYLVDPRAPGSPADRTDPASGRRHRR